MTIPNSTVSTLRKLLDEAEAILQKAGFSQARFEAEYLLQSVLDLSKAQLFLSIDNGIAPDDYEVFCNMLRRRQKLEPLQYIVGQVEFWSRDFQVNPDVLIPRQETEFVLEQILLLVRQHKICCEQVLDMGTGSGVIADVLAAELDCQVVGVDCSVAALKVAQTNVLRHNLSKRISFLCSDLFLAVQPQQQFDLIVSNPPYVAETEKEDLHPQVLDHEPGGALFAGMDGLDCYRRLIPESVEYLRCGGWLCLEIGASQGEAITGMLLENRYNEVAILTDYAGRARLALGRKDACI